MNTANTDEMVGGFSLPRSGFVQVRLPETCDLSRSGYTALRLLISRPLLAAKLGSAPLTDAAHYECCDLGPEPQSPSRQASETNARVFSDTASNLSPSGTL